MHLPQLTLMILLTIDVLIAAGTSVQQKDCRPFIRSTTSYFVIIPLLIWGGFFSH